MDICNNLGEKKATLISVRKKMYHFKLSHVKANTKGLKDCQLPNDDSWKAPCFYEFLFLCQRSDGLWAKENPFETGAPWKLELLSKPAKFCHCRIGSSYNEAEQLQFPLQLGNVRLCASCHPVLIWALMYFINKGLLSSLTVVTPWFQCRMHAGRGYTINNQLAAITPF